LCPSLLLPFLVITSISVITPLAWSLAGYTTAPLVAGATAPLAGYTTAPLVADATAPLSGYTTEPLVGYTTGPLAGYTVRKASVERINLGTQQFIPELVHQVLSRFA
jgi:hypothetical protein